MFSYLGSRRLNGETKFISVITKLADAQAVLRALLKASQFSQA